MTDLRDAFTPVHEPEEALDRLPGRRGVLELRRMAGARDHLDTGVANPPSELVGVDARHQPVALAVLRQDCRE